MCQFAFPGFCRNSRLSAANEKGETAVSPLLVCLEEESGLGHGRYRFGDVFQVLGIQGGQADAPG